MKSRDIPNLHKFLNCNVIVTTVKNKKYSGIFKGHDAYTNIVLTELDKFDYVVVRGDNIKDIQRLQNK